MIDWLKNGLKLLSSKQRHQHKYSGESAPSAGSSSNHRKHRAARNATSDLSRQSKKVEEYLADAKIVTRGEHSISREHIDDNALKVLYRLHKAGFHACLVGGAVRDLLLAKTPKDFDVATNATPEQVKDLFRNCRLIGRRFRLAHVHFGRQIIEVATYRTNHDHTQSGSVDESGRIVRDNVYGGIDDDVWRRDFTANALYYDIANFSIIDFVGGLEDIRQRQLKMIGDAQIRYREDPVRMLRAIRFAAKLDFSIEEKSRTPIYELGSLLQDIPPARLYEEVLKLFHSGHALKSFEALNEYDLLHYLFPAAAQAIKDDPQHLRLLQLAMKNTDDRICNNMRVTPAFLFAALLWAPVAKRAEEINEKGMPYSVAIQKAATAVMSQQVKSISIPRRFTSTMRDIWGLQTRFHYRKGRRAQAVLEHPKFRAAYDFLCLRAQSGEAVADESEWWTQFQQQSSSNTSAVSESSGGKASDSKSSDRRRRRKPRSQNHSSNQTSDD